MPRREERAIVVEDDAARPERRLAEERRFRSERCDNRPVQREGYEYHENREADPAERAAHGSVPAAPPAPNPLMYSSASPKVIAKITTEIAAP